MRLALLARALLWMQASLAGPATSAPETVIWFGGDRSGLDERALLEAVAVYTRDLRLAVESAAAPLPASGADRPGAAGAALRARGARLGFWCELRDDGRAILLTTVDRAGRAEVHVVEDARPDEPELYRAIALKLRTAVVATVGTETLAAPAAVPPPAPANAPAAGPAVPTIAAGPPPRTSARGVRPFVTAGYRLSAPLGTAPLRNAAFGEAALALERPLEVALGTELAPRATTGTPAGSVSVFDLPIALAARAAKRGPRWTFAAGLVAAVHLQWATAAAGDGSAAQASSFSAAPGVGLEAIARTRLPGGLGGELRLDAEVGVPSTRYWVRGVPTLDVGSRVGVAVGIVLPSP